MPVVRLRPAIEAHPYVDAKIVEQPQVRIVKADPVRLHPDVHLHPRTNSGVGGAHEFGDKFTSGKQRLPTVQDKRHARYLVTAGVLADAHRGTAGDLHRHPARTVTPRLVRHLVHIAVVTREIAPTVDLDDELAEGNGPPTAGYKTGYIKSKRPFDSGCPHHGPIKPYTSVEITERKGDYHR
jgi:hypothetical protein